MMTHRPVTGSRRISDIKGTLKHRLNGVDYVLVESTVPRPR
jgi:hypothetical protein